MRGKVKQVKANTSRAPGPAKPEGYDFAKAEKKWRAVWRREGVYEPSFLKAKKPFYNLMMFPYPSAEGLHIGAVRTYSGVDIYGRRKRMQGFDVFEPIGLDGFGIHSENFALKVGRHPAAHAKISEKNFYRQLDSIGNGFAWKERLETYDPEYYQWTQWIFTRLFKAGLAYRKKQAVNWCPKDKTVLSDEQVEGGVCERCGAVAEKKELEQWFFRITSYAEELLQNLEQLDWTEKIKLAQKNWIGRSEGAEIDFPLSFGAYSGDVVFATNNVSKLEHMQRLMKAAGLNINLKLPKDIGIDDYRVEEDGKSIAENSEKKARALFGRTTLPILGEDSSFVIEGVNLDPLKVKRNALKGKNERKLTIEQIGELMAAYYQKIAADRGGSVDAEWQSDVCLLTPEGFTLHGAAVRPVTLSAKSGGKVDPYLPLRNLYIPKSTGKHAQLQTPEEELVELQPLTDAVKKLFTPAIKVYTTRPDTLFGATYLVLAPEHPFVTAALEKPDLINNKKEVSEYVETSKKKSEEERIVETKDKSGVEIKGLKAINPVTKEKIPIWIADYVLGGYGTGAIMAVPGHDERDLEFARKFNLPIRKVVQPKPLWTDPFFPNQIRAASGMPEDTIPHSDCWTGEGVLVNSGSFDGMASEEAKWAIAEAAGGARKVQYRLRDWLISRQRYWGPPIPMIFCEACAAAGKGEREDMPGWHTVPEKDLPVKLPMVKEFQPRGTGESPLSTVKSFYEARCPACKSKARRETDVSDTFLDSAWYYLRYPSVNDKKHAWDPAITKKWFPVDMYIGGPEHSVLHLLYVRFISLAFRDMGILSSVRKTAAPAGEPFPTFRAHGLITKDGAKMSKSKGNVVNPDEYLKKFGADVMRMYLAFLAPLTQGGDFRDEGIVGVTRFLDRMWKAVNSMPSPKEDSEDVRRALHRTIKKVGEDIESLQYNTAISALMICLNEVEKAGSLSRRSKEALVKLLAPFTPFLAEDLWRTVLGHKGSVHKEAWPAYDEKLIASKMISLVIQVNGKTRATIEVPAGIPEAEARGLALAETKILALLNGRSPSRVIYVPGRLINIVV